jgi:LuxR family maltose regulon positive regulatory protein
VSTAILATKLYVPPGRSKVVLRPRLIERLNEGLNRRLTLISAPAGFGKTTLVGEWLHSGFALRSGEPNRSFRVAWLSLDEGDNDPARFLTYLVAALQTIAPQLGQGVLIALQSPQPPPVEVVLATLLNEVTTLLDRFILVLDDYHVIDAKAVDDAVTFLLEHLPPQMHLLVATREDPRLPLTRLRVGDQLTELRAADLRFTPAEAADFLNQVMGLNLSEQDIAALESRTEGWIAGLQLAAISMRGQGDVTGFIKSFTGSHRFVMDYLMEQVLQKQPARIQHFLLRTSILDRLCGSLCDAVLPAPAGSGQQTLEYLDHANLFVVPLDNERHWYRYHRLFGDLLQQRLSQSVARTPEAERESIAGFHVRASQWYEDNRLPFEAFHHAASANDIERAERLIEGRKIPLHFPGAVTTVLDWLSSLPTTVLDARPALWVRYGAMTLVIGKTTGVEQRLQAAEAALARAGLVPRAIEEMDSKTRNLVGQIATARATLALTRYDVDKMIAQSQRALEYLLPENIPFRTSALWTLGVAYFWQGERAAARRAITDALSLSQPAGDTFATLLSTISLGQIQESDNQLHPAFESYQRAIELAGDPALSIACEAQLGLARIAYEWNDLNAAEQHAQQSLQLARQYEQVIDRYIATEVFIARIKLARGDVEGAVELLAQTEQSARQNNFLLRMPEIAAVQVLAFLEQGNLGAAEQLAQTYSLSLSHARVLLADGKSAEALHMLEPLRQQMEAKGWHDETLKVMVLQAVALQAHGDRDKALQGLADTLVLAEPGGFVRLFVDEGRPMAQLVSESGARSILPGYTAKLLAAFGRQPPVSRSDRIPQPLVEPLSPRELEVLRLMAQGLSNQEIGERLFLALDTVKGHNRRIFDKLQVQRRTEAVARARELGLV